MLDTMPYEHITRKTIPDSLRGKIHVISVPQFPKLSSQREKCELILDSFCKSGAWEDTCRTDAVVFDVLEHVGAYFPSIHTDTEWNSVMSHGYIFENPILEKTLNHSFFIRSQGEELLLVKSCARAEYYHRYGVNPRYILGRMSIEQFVRTTKMYYLDFEPGDCMIFKKNLIHMSDYRDNTKLRKSFNFRVAHTNRYGKLDFSSERCGFVKSINRRQNQKTPTKYEFVL